MAETEFERGRRETCDLVARLIESVEWPTFSPLRQAVGARPADTLGRLRALVELARTLKMDEPAAGPSSAQTRKE